MEDDSDDSWECEVLALLEAGALSQTPTPDMARGSKPRRGGSSGGGGGSSSGGGGGGGVGKLKCLVACAARHA